MSNKSRTSLDGYTAKPAQQADELARAFINASNTGKHTEFASVLARNLQSYGIDGVRSRTGLKAY